MKKLKTMGDLMAGAVPSIAEPAPRRKAAPKAVEQVQLVVQLPNETVKALKQRALNDNTSVRALLVDALHNAGYAGTSGQAVDFRKVRRS
jgi:hypothetical protein